MLLDSTVAAVYERRWLTTRALIPDKIYPIASADYPLPATRPQNSRLDCSLLENVFQLKLPPWHEQR
jgi:dTDP-4-dehydrorhamnose reductase